MIRNELDVLESKTQEIERARGHKQFTIKREWLEKLEREAPDENMEYWSLAFSFKDNDEKIYAVMDQQLLLDCIATMVERKSGFLIARLLPDRTAENMAKAIIESIFVPSSPAAPSFETKRSKSSGVAIPRTPNAAPKPLGLNH